MAVDYLIMKSCEVKKEVPVLKLVESIKNRNQVLTISELLRQEGRSNNDIYNHEFAYFLTDGNQSKTIRKKIGDALNQTNYLVGLEHYCTTCPVSNGKSFGCYGAISYPISGKCERWIAALAYEGYQKGGVFRLMIEYILDQKVSGHQTQAAQSHRNTFFELGSPIDIVLDKGWFSKKAVNTNQLFDVII